METMTTPQAPILHYIYDPLCGWCYAASPLVRAAAEIDGLAIRLHGGGMMAGPYARRVTPELRDYVMPHDRRIHELTGQPFGDDYFDGLLRNPDAVFDSAPPITAILAAGAIPHAPDDLPLRMLTRVQHAHYAEGRQISERGVLEALAEELGATRADFAHAFDACAGHPTDLHIDHSRTLLGTLGGQGFPTFALERGGEYLVIDMGRWLGQPERWRDMLRQQLDGAQPAAVGEEPAGPECWPDGCAT